MKKTYSMPLVTASDVVRATETGATLSIVEFSTKFHTQV
jgi:hypothetical protein